MEYITEPWEHQRKEVEESLLQPNRALLWDPGCGKTKTAIDILRHRYAHYQRVARTIIFAPPVVLRNWKNEFKIHSKIPDDKVFVLTGNGSKRIERLKEILYNHQTCDYDNPCVLILNYEAVQNKSIYQILIQWKPEIFIGDEAHRCKSYQSTRAKLIAQLADLARHRYILTGTPVLNSLMDLYMQFRILDGGDTFGQNFFVFRARYFEDENASWSHRPNHFPKFVPRPSTYKEFSDLIYKKASRVKKEECLDLPPLIKTTRDVELSPDQVKMYKEMKDEFITWVRAETTEEAIALRPPTVIAQLAVTKALRLQQIVSGFVKDDTGLVLRIPGPNPRLTALEDLLGEITPNHKVIVWASFVENYKMISELCEEMKIKYSQIVGGMSDKDREHNLNQFRANDEVRVLIANQGAAGIGINLIEASYMIYYSKSFSLEHDIQSEARNYRAGSERHDSITRIDLVAPKTIDEIINKALASKQSLSDRILEISNQL